MTRDETVKVLSILKVAYPNFYKGLSKQEASAVVNLWSMQFKNIPYDIVVIAVNKIIATNTFPPAIAEIKAKLKNIYAEAVTGIMDYRIDEKTKDKLRRIEAYCRTVDTEPSLTQILGSYDGKVALPDEAYDKQSS